MDVQSVSTAIAGALAGLGVRVYDYGPAAPVSPCAWIYPETLPYHADFGSEITAQFVVRFLVAANAERNSQALLNALISNEGTQSAVAALEEDNTLGGAVSSLRCVESRNYGIVMLPDQSSKFYSAELVCEVFA